MMMKIGSKLLEKAATIAILFSLMACSPVTEQEPAESAELAASSPGNPHPIIRNAFETTDAPVLSEPIS